MKTKMNVINLDRWPLGATISLGLLITQHAFGQTGPPPPPVPWLINWQAPTATPPQPAPAVPQVLTGSVPPALAALGLTPIGNLAATQVLQLAISLPLRNQEGLVSLVEDIYSPGSPNYRQYLTPEQFTAMFGPTEDDYQAAAAFAAAQGLTVTEEFPNRVVLDVGGR